MSLTPKQQRFVDEFVVDLNATQAAIRAGFSAKTAKQQGARLLTNVNVAAAVAERQTKRLDKLDVKADRVVSEIAAGALYDPADLVTQPIKKPADIAKLPEQVRRAIVGWSWDRRGNFVLKLADKSRSLDMLARHLGLYRDAPGGSGMTLEMLVMASIKLRDERAQPPIEGEARRLDQQQNDEARA